MPDDQTPSPAADAAGSPQAASSSQSAPATSLSPSAMFNFGDIFEDSDIPDGADDAAAVLSGDASQPTDAAATASDAKPAPSSTDEGVSAADAPESGKESDTPANLSRRQREAAEKDAEIARLKAIAEANDPVKLREQLREEILAEQAQKANIDQETVQARQDAERYNRLIAVPAAQLSDEDWAWVENQKALRASAPAAERAIRADAERYLAEQQQALQQQAEQAVAAGWDQIRNDITAQIDASTALPNVDKAAFKAPGVTWQQMAETIHAAGAAWKEAALTERVTTAEAETARLKQENADLQARLLSGRRVPANVGRTAGAAPSANGFDVSRGWRGNLADVFDTN